MEGAPSVVYRGIVVRKRGSYRSSASATGHSRVDNTIGISEEEALTR